MERFRFYNLKQRNEDISNFIVRIKELASKCSFGNFLNDALRDKLVCGLNDSQIQNKLLSEKDLTFQKACEIALACESAHKEAKSLKGIDSHNIFKINEENKKFINNNNKKIDKFKKINKNFEKNTYVDSKNFNKNKCKHCGKIHFNECIFKDATCYRCKRKGHIATICKSKISNYIEVSDSKTRSDDLNELFQLNNLCVNKDLPQPYEINVEIGKIRVKMQIDTGSAHSIISLDNFKKLKLNNLNSLKHPNLRTYSDNELNVTGKFLVPVKFEGRECLLPLIVVQVKDKPTLMGRLWIERLDVNINKYKSSYSNEIVNKKYSEVNYSSNASIIEFYKIKFPNCFNLIDNKGILGEPVNIVMKENTIPIFCKSRPIPYAMKDMVDKELDSLINNGTLEKVNHSKWATPIVAVQKMNSDGSKSVRICGDFSVTVNKFCETQFYPLPSQEEILNNIGIGKYFTKIDLSKAFHQLPIALESQEMLTLNTPKGLLKYTKLPFGIKSASFLFQQKMDSILKGLPFTECYIDDVIIHGNTKDECIKRTELVLDKLNYYNVKVNISKCEFFRENIKILGHIKDSNGIHPLNEKYDDIKNTPLPTNVTELKSYLGLLGYYQHFIPNLASEIKPLYRLLEKNVKWYFNDQCVKTFERSKTFLKKHNILIHYDPSKPIILQCDASDYGVGAVLCHEMTPGLLQPIFFASKTMSKAEQNYAQVHKEALAIIFGIKRFNKYLQGQKFTIETDSKPLLSLLGNDKPVPQMVNARMQRWALILSNYDYIIKYKKGSDLLLADTMSRLPCKDEETVDEFSYFYYFSSEFDDLKSEEICKQSKMDPAISKVINYTKYGWPTSNVPDELREFHRIKDELSVEDDCLLRANRLVIPNKLRNKVLELLHDEHPGIVRMKCLARSYFWFPGIDKCIEIHVNNCIPCQATRSKKEKVPSNFWPLASKPFERIHIDYAECENYNLLIVKDAYSKWIEAYVVNSMSSNSTITKLRSLFACFGLPKLVVSDNAAQFKSEEFQKFLMSNGVEFKNSPPYHPNSNGAAERAVDVVKKMLLKQKLSKKVYENFQHRVDSALFAYRNTPTSINKKTPSELIFKYIPQTKITKLIKDHFVKEKNYQDYQITHRNKNLLPRYFKEGERIWVRSVRNNEIKWFMGYIIKVISDNTYLAKVNNVTRYVHADHLRKCKVQENESSFDSIPSDATKFTSNEINKGNVSEDSSVVKMKADDDMKLFKNSNNHDVPKFQRPKRTIVKPHRLNL